MGLIILICTACVDLSDGVREPGVTFYEVIATPPEGFINEIRNFWMSITGDRSDGPTIGPGKWASNPSVEHGCPNLNLAIINGYRLDGAFREAGDGENGSDDGTQLLDQNEHPSKAIQYAIMILRAPAKASGLLICAHLVGHLTV